MFATICSNKLNFDVAVADNDRTFSRQKLRSQNNRAKKKLHENWWVANKKKY